MLPGLQVFQILSEKEGVVSDNIAKARVLHSNLFEKQQPGRNIHVEVKSQQHGAYIGPLFQLPQIHTCNERRTFKNLDAITI